MKVIKFNKMTLLMLAIVVLSSVTAATVIIQTISLDRTISSIASDTGKITSSQVYDPDTSTSLNPIIESIRKSRLILTTVSLCFLIVTILITYLIYTNTVGKLNHILRKYARISAVDAEYERGSNDPFAEISNLCDNLYDKYKSLLTEIGIVSTRIDDIKNSFLSIAELTEKANSTNNRVMADITDLFGQQEKGFSSLTNLTEELSSALSHTDTQSKVQETNIEKTENFMEDMFSKVFAATEIIKGLDEKTRFNQDEAAHGNEALENFLKGMGEIEDGMNATLDSVKKLEDGSRQIGEIVDVINDVADQTSLLALNAAIEAARAGEHGKGFAVVAEEVRRLADRTSESTNQISAIIKNLIESIQSSLVSVDKNSSLVREGTELTMQAAQVLREIDLGTGSTAKAAKDLLSIADTFNTQSQQVSEIMTDFLHNHKQSGAYIKDAAARSKKISGVVDEMISVVSCLSDFSKEASAAKDEISSVADRIEQTVTSFDSLKSNLSKYV